MLYPLSYEGRAWTNGRTKRPQLGRIGVLSWLRREILGFASRSVM